MTPLVTISRDGGGPLPWGVYRGGVKLAWCATLADAKECARDRFGIDRWHREGAGDYVEVGSE